MSGELPHVLTHQDQLLLLAVTAEADSYRPYSDSLVPTTGHTYSPQPQATTQCIQGPDALSWRLTELSVASRRTTIVDPMVEEDS